jgi:hypothetical protein
VEEQEGAIAIINGDTFSLEKRLEINLDPFDLVVDSKGYIYVASGSGQHTKLKSYDSNGVEQSSEWIYHSTYIELAPAEDKIYAIDTALSPRDIAVYPISSEVIHGEWDSPYHGEYDLNEQINISPDGKYVFNNIGYVFDGETLNFHGELDYDYSDILFNDSVTEFYLGRNGLMLGYDYNSFHSIGALSTYGDIRTLHQNKTHIVILSNMFIEDTTVPAIGCRRQVEFYTFCSFPFYTSAEKMLFRFFIR